MIPTNRFSDFFRPSFDAGAALGSAADFQQARSRAVRWLAVVASGMVAACLCLAQPGAARAALVGYWSFDGQSGTSVNDFSPNANTGTLGGTLPTWVVNGGNTGAAPDNALFFGGGTTFVNVAPSATLSTVTNKFTIAAWLNENAHTNYGHIVVTTSNFANRTWLWQTENSSGGDQQWIHSTTVGAWSKPLGYTNPNGVWNHYTFTYDGTLGSNQLKRYTNGVFSSQYTVTGSPNFPAFVGGGLYIGGWLAGNSSYNGRLDDVVIFNTVEDPVTIHAGTHAELISEINIVGNGNNIADGDVTPTTTDHTNFGTVITGATAVTRTFTVQNTAAADIVFTSPASITGGVTPFTISTPLPSLISGGGSTPLGVQMATGTVGSFTRTVNVSNTDADESAYDFAISGTVLEHSKGEFRGQGLGSAVSQTLSNNDQTLTIDFGTVLQGAGGGQLDSFFDIFADLPIGLLPPVVAKLTLDSITGGGAGFSLPGAGTFSDMTAGLASGSTDYTARFLTSTPGSFSVSYTFNMHDEHAYDGLGATPHTLTLNLQGNVQAVPEPNALLLAGLGLLGLGVCVGRRRQA